MAGGIVASVLASTASVQAQDASTANVSRHHRRAMIVSNRGVRPEPSPTERGLTITRRPQSGLPDLGDDDDIYVDGAVRYNSVRTFDPAPYVDSGRQYPFGLDGIGGYGSDLGFGAGHDSALYDRGP